MADVPETVLAALAAPVARALPVITSRIPPGPAAELGRLAVPWHERPASLFRNADRVAQAQSGRGPLLAERLLGALELTIAELDLTGAPDLSPYLPPLPQGRPGLTLVSMGGQSQAETARQLLQQLRAGTADLAASLTRQLAGHQLIIPLLAASGHLAGEEPIAAAHGAAYLALAVATASALTVEWWTSVLGSRAAAVVGVAIGAVTPLLRDSPMPAGYAAALLELARAEYQLPAHGSTEVSVSDHRFALAEGHVLATSDFSGNGLVAVVPGGVLIRTGLADGSLSVGLRVLAREPPLAVRSWDEVIEVSWPAAAGRAKLMADQNWLAGRYPGVTTPPWPGDYRLRVHATGRDDGEHELYDLVVWQAPAAPEIVYKRTDRLGYRLRGEPYPVRPPRPEHTYRWVQDSSLQVAATVTMVTGSNTHDVLRAFGADPAQPLSLSGMQYSDEMWVSVLETSGAVVAVENNGFQGADEGVLRRASVSGRAASMFWNVNAVTRLSFAEGGQLLAAFEPGMEPPEEAEAVPSIVAALDGLDFEDYRDTNAKGLVAVERFTGCGFTPQDLERIEDADIGYRITTD